MTIYSKLIELADSFFQMDRTLEKFGDVYVYFRIFGDVRAFVNNVLAPFVPNGVWKVAECGVFIARNQVQNLRIWRTMLISLISVVKGFVVR